MLRRLQPVLNTVQLGVTIADAEGKILYANPAVAAMHGYTVEELIGQNVTIFEPSGASPPMPSDAPNQKRSWRHEGLHLRKDGSTFPVHVMSDMIEGAAGAAAVVTTCEDITDRWRAEEALRDKQARESLAASLHDPLTGLPNRAMLMDLVRRALSRAKRRDDYLFAVLVINLDRFHVVNDSLGHAVGDQLLIGIAERLKPVFRPVDVLARLSGDEFGVLVDDINDISDTLRVTNRIHQGLKAPFQIAEDEVFSSGRVGIALSRTGYDLPEDMLRDATLALHRAKARGDAYHEVFDLVMHRSANARLQLETDLRWAVERQEFRTYYQPIVSLVTGEITGMEALVRWAHPRRGLLSPHEFLLVAEETGTIIPLGSSVLQQACSQMKEWQNEFPESALTLSVNLSGNQIMRRDLLQEIDQILKETGLDARSLRLEMTETVVMDDAEPTLQILSKLKELRVHLDIDDFGTGYSSLRYLHRFPIDALKIDRSFVKNIDDRGESAEIVRTILALAKNVGVQVVAEGVETAEQLAILKSMECEQAQGYFFSEPVQANEVAGLIRAGGSSV